MLKKQQFAKCNPTKTITQNLPLERKAEQVLKSIEKNLIISNYKPKLRKLTDKKIKSWLIKFEILFKILEDSTYSLEDSEKIKLAVCSVPDEAVEWFQRNASQITSWIIFKNKLADKFKDGKDNKNKIKANDWVKIFNEEDMPGDQCSTYETGLVHTVLDNNLFLVACKGRVLTVHGKNLERI
ncbi:hypothetical protein EDEG_01281 [Edhazardia aedis USNM 41457]|uniref:Uncharacterized protein n=1 Tax=Edhazardia aedis (strain USNM 41457) TaxID=1003232 RepID=J8ZXW1_EDHAE|nr:hypothetical protein EDEG_01281 [Edhazardia aedis USNM 41457]|eukprot:EJW04513.1 hypothetical protein EDEG_01281 [Edhazardia aedis USNM 41457]